MENRDSFAWRHPWLTMLFSVVVGLLVGGVFPMSWMLGCIFGVVLLAVVVWVFRHPLLALIALFIGLN
jgi:hypothetical protein